MIQRLYTERQQKIVNLAEQLAAEFEPRAAKNDLNSSFPFDNFTDMQRCGYMAATVPVELGGLGANLLELTMAQSRLAAGCGATALAVNMHLSVVGQMARRWLTTKDKRLEKQLRAVVDDGEVFAPITAEPGHALVRSTGTTARRVPGGYLVSGRKTFGTGSAVMTRLMSMAVDTQAPAGPMVLFFTVPADAPGVSVVKGSWCTMGMRATLSENVVLDNVFVDDDAVYLRFPAGSLDGSLLQGLFGWAWPTFGAVYLGIAEGALRRCEDEIRRRGWEHRARVRAAIEECVLLVESATAVVEATARLVMTNELWTRLTVRDAMARVLLAKIAGTNSAVAVVDKVMGIVGSQALRSGSYFERAYRDVRAGTMHPYSAVDATDFIAEAALGLPGPPEHPPVMERLAVYTDACQEGTREAPEPGAMSKERARDLIGLFTRAFNTGDLSALDACVTEDYVHRNDSVPQGREGLKEAVRRWRAGLSGLTVTVDDVIAHGDQVAARMTIEGRHTGPLFGISPTGRQVTFGLIDIWRVRDSMFAEHWDQADRLGLLQQLGALPAPHKEGPANG
jgi:alkylation response protein AidB-like acyl-CoA dehydrogenase/predicted ester cyclase